LNHKAVEEVFIQNPSEHALEVNLIKAPSHGLSIASDEQFNVTKEGFMGFLIPGKSEIAVSISWSPVNDEAFGLHEIMCFQEGANKFQIKVVGQATKPQVNRVLSRLFE
jgi:hypothetical protein